jgi:predicted transposase YdaD
MANDYDRIFKENIEAMAPSIIKRLLKIDPSRLIPYRAKMQVTLEREMDFVSIVKAENETEKDYGLHIEFHTSNEDMRARNLVYYGMFHLRTNLELKQVLIYIGKDRATFIKENHLELEGLEHTFIVIILAEVPKEIFIDSDVPEDVVTSILCDFGADSQETVVKMILTRLHQLLGGGILIEKFQKQLLTLARLRDLETLVKNQIEAMTFHYDIENDGLYLEGIEKGIEQGREEGREEGIELKTRNFAQTLWDQQEFSLEKMALLIGLDETQLQTMLVEIMVAAGELELDAQQIISDYKLKFSDSQG